MPGLAVRRCKSLSYSLPQLHNLLVLDHRHTCCANVAEPRDFYYLARRECHLSLESDATVDR